MAHRGGTGPDRGSSHLPPAPSLRRRSSFPGHRGALGPSGRRPGPGTAPQRPQRCPPVRPRERGPSHPRLPCPSARPERPRSQPAGGGRSRGVHGTTGARRGAAGLCAGSSRRRQGAHPSPLPQHASWPSSHHPGPGRALSLGLLGQNLRQCPLPGGASEKLLHAPGQRWAKGAPRRAAFPPAGPPSPGPARHVPLTPAQVPQALESSQTWMRWA